jgi:hypothetical protein
MASKDRQIGERSAAVGHSYGHTLIEMAPSPAPARQLADLLWDSRRRGYDFETAFKQDSEFAVRHIPRPTARREWREAFADTREAWRAAWFLVPGPGDHLSAALLDALSGDYQGLALLG